MPSWAPGNAVAAPRGIVFCQTIQHCERMAAPSALRRPGWRAARRLHASMIRPRTTTALLDFRSAASRSSRSDILNEGVDVPDVNIICFARVTHSRRIFVQQLGRGLRLR